MFYKELKQLYSQILEIGVNKVTDEEEQSKIRIMNYWLSIGLVITLINMLIGVMVDFYSYFIPSAISFVVVIAAYILTYLGRHELSWYTILSVPAVVLTILPAFSDQIVPTCLKQMNNVSLIYNLLIYVLIVSLTIFESC